MPSSFCCYHSVISGGVPTNYQSSSTSVYSSFSRSICCTVNGWATISLSSSFWIFLISSPPNIRCERPLQAANHPNPPPLLLLKSYRAGGCRSWPSRGSRGPRRGTWAGVQGGSCCAACRAGTLWWSVAAGCSPLTLSPPLLTNSGVQLTWVLCGGALLPGGSCKLCLHPH